MDAFVSFTDVSKYYQTGDIRVAAADHMTFHVNKGEFCVIVGPSGAGKTTLLNMLGGMDRCDEGRIVLDGAEVSRFNEKELTRLPALRRGVCVPVLQPGSNLTALKTWSWPSRSAATPWTPPKPSRAWGLGSGSTTSLPSCPAANSSGSPSPAPWPKTPRSFCATSPPAPWTTRPASRCWPFCRTPAGKPAGPSSSSPTHSFGPVGRPDRPGAQRPDHLQ